VIVIDNKKVARHCSGYRFIKNTTGSWIYSNTI